MRGRWGCGGGVACDVSELAPVVQEGLEVVVDVDRPPYEPEVECPERSDILVVVILYELNHNVLFRLKLEELEDEADEGRRFIVASVCSADVVELHGLLHQRLG